MPIMFSRRSEHVRTALVCCGFLLLILLFILGTSGELPHLIRAERSLFQWDGHFYASIVREGYYVRRLNWPIQGNPTDGRTNVAFFPAYPFLTLLITLITFLPVDLALVVTSQLACLTLVTYAFILLRRMLPPHEALAFLLLFFGMPTAFFLMASLPESLLLAGLAGYLYWSCSDARHAAVLTILHGMVMTATKPFGIPLVLLPLITPLLHRDRKEVFRRAWMAGGSLMGVALFLLGCQFAFGHWDLYFAVQRTGWNIRPAYGFFLHAETLRALLFPWTIVWPEYTDYTGTAVANLSQRENFTAIAIALWVLLLWPVIEIMARWLGVTGWRERATFHLGALGSVLLMIAATLSVDLQSAVRYLLTPAFLFLLAVAHFVSSLPRRRWRTAVILLLLGTLAIPGYALQWKLAGIFLRGGWVG